MKLKTIIVLLCIIFTIFFIYLTTLDRKVYYLSIGDYIITGMDEKFTWNQKIVNELKKKKKFEVYINEFSNMNLRTTDLIYQIKNNEKKMVNGEEKSIKNALIKADLVTLSIGMNDFLYKMNLDVEEFSMEELYDYVDEMSEDTDILLRLLREYCKEDIMMTNYYVPRNMNSDKANKMIYYANKRLESMAEAYQIEIIDLSTYTVNSSYFDHDTALLSDKGEEELGNEVMEVVNKTLLN